MAIKIPKHPDITVKVLDLRDDNAAIIIECRHCTRIAPVCKTCCQSRTGASDRQYPRLV